MKKITLYFATLLLMVASITFAQSGTNCWKMLSAGAGHVVAINDEGTLFTWGRDNYGQLGHGYSHTGIPVEPKTTVKFKFITTGMYKTYAISTTGHLYGCGQYALNGSADVSKLQQIGTDTDWKSVHSSEGRVIFLKANGTMWGFGDKNVTGSTPIQIGIDTNWETFTSSNVFTVGLKTNGTMWSWGKNQYGELGNGSTTDNYEPTQIGTDTDWATISSEKGHVLALKTDGTLWGWGANSSYQLGNGTKVSSAIPIQIGSDNDWAFINAESGYSIAIKSNGTMWIWGSSGYDNIMGNGGYKSNNPLPTQIGTEISWKSVTAAYSYVLATKIDGSLWAWGSNLHLNYGNGSNKNSLVPILVGGCSSLGTEKWESNSLTVYPNPSSGIFNIQTNTSIENASITIADLNGRTVHQSKAENIQNKVLDLNQLQSGIYILNIKNGTYNYSQKIVKQ